MRSRGAHGLPAIRAGSGTNGADPVHPRDRRRADGPARPARARRESGRRAGGSPRARLHGGEHRARGRSRACGRRASPTSAASGDYAGPPRCDDVVSVCIATFNVASGPARWVVRLVGAEWSIGFSRSERKPFDVTLWPVGVHKIEENNRLMAALGIDAAARPYRWVVSPDEARVARLDSASAQRTYIAVTPGSNPRERFKRWPPKMYCRPPRPPVPGRPRGLRDRRRPVGCGRRPGDPRGGSRAERRARVVDLTGKLTLAESAAVLARCAVVVGGDCGLTHLGAALGRNVVVLAGPTRPEVTLPVGPSVTQRPLRPLLHGMLREEAPHRPRLSAPGLHGMAQAGGCGDARARCGRLAHPFDALVESASWRLASSRSKWLSQVHSRSMKSLAARDFLPHVSSLSRRLRAPRGRSSPGRPRSSNRIQERRCLRWRRNS